MRIEDLNPKGFPTTPVILHNLELLAAAMTDVERAYGNFLMVNSGLRSFLDHERIYRDLNKTRSQPLHVPMQSAHLIGLAVDVADRSKKVWGWAMKNLVLLEKLGLYLEIRMGGWVHFQLKAPRSGHRIFQP